MVKRLQVTSSLIIGYFSGSFEVRGAAQVVLGCDGARGGRLSLSALSCIHYDQAGLVAFLSGLHEAC